MPSCIDNAIKAMTDTLRDAAGVAVTYSRGEHSVEITAVVGHTDVEMEDDRGSRMVSPTRDYLIAADELILDGSETEPEDGDRIVQVVGATRYTYELSPLMDRCWRYSDSGGDTLRCHTLEIDSEAVL